MENLVRVDILHSHCNLYEPLKQQNTGYLLPTTTVHDTRAQIRNLLILIPNATMICVMGHKGTSRDFSDSFFNYSLPRGWTLIIMALG